MPVVDTIILSNGSGFKGTIGDLLTVLATESLDTERFWFSFPVPHWSFYMADGSVVEFFGNFRNFSHVFDIRSEDPTVIEPLREAILANLARQNKPAMIEANGTHGYLVPVTA